MSYTLEHAHYVAHDEATSVAITKQSPYTYLERRLLGDVTHLSDGIIIDKVLQVVQDELNPSGSIQELKGSTEKLTEKLTEIDAVIQDAKDTIEQVKKDSMMTQSALMEAVASMTLGLANNDVELGQVGVPEIEELQPEKILGETETEPGHHTEDANPLEGGE